MPIQSLQNRCAKNLQILLPWLLHYLHGLIKSSPESKQSLPELQFLARVQRFPGISLQGLADDLGIHKATASARAEQLVEAGLLLRKTNPDSRRAIMLELTPAGLSYYQEAKDFIKTHLIAQMNHFSSDELQTLESGLNLLARMVLHAQPELRDKLSEMET